LTQECFGSLTIHEQVLMAQSTRRFHRPAGWSPRSRQHRRPQPCRFSIEFYTAEESHLPLPRGRGCRVIASVITWKFCRLTYPQVSLSSRPFSQVFPGRLRFASTRGFQRSTSRRSKECGQGARNDTAQGSSAGCAWRCWAQTAASFQHRVLGAASLLRHPSGCSRHGANRSRRVAVRNSRVIASTTGRSSDMHLTSAWSQKSCHAWSFSLATCTPGVTMPLSQS
jgi:hypothetical protein